MGSLVLCEYSNTQGSQLVGHRGLNWGSLLGGCSQESYLGAWMLPVTNWSLSFRESLKAMQFNQNLSLASSGVCSEVNHTLHSPPTGQRLSVLACPGMGLQGGVGGRECDRSIYLLFLPSSMYSFLFLCFTKCYNLSLEILGSCDQMLCLFQSLFSSRNFVTQVMGHYKRLYSDL